MIPPVVNFIAGGWQLNGVYQRQSGAPIGFGQALFTGDSSKIALPSDQRNADRWFNTGVFNIRVDSQRRWDFSLIKYFHVNERVNFQFRAETYNVLNEPVLRGPTTDPYNSSFGRVTAQEPPRSWQFSLKLAW